MSGLAKSVLITGASRGIGRAIALQLSRDGFNVALADLGSQEKEGYKVVKQIEMEGGKADFIPCNVVKRDEVFKAVEFTHQKFGTFNVIVNNAGICKVKFLDEVDEQDIDNIFDVNYKGVMWGIQAAAEKFRNLKQPGKIINACSIGGYRAVEGLGTYCTSKFAVRALTHVAAKEYARDKITVNSFCPGNVTTPMWDYIDEKLCERYNWPIGTALKKTLDETALGRLQKPEDLGDLVSFLASEKANFITGQNYVSDGGIYFN